MIKYLGGRLGAGGMWMQGYLIVLTTDNQQPSIWICVAACAGRWAVLRCAIAALPYGCTAVVPGEGQQRHTLLSGVTQNPASVHAICAVQTVPPDTLTRSIMIKNCC
jgi:hypothetical protein